MAAGTDAGLLEDEPLQSFMKHRLLKRYGMVFTHKLSRGTGKIPVTLVDGYAGTGRYPDGKPASAELMIQSAAAAEPGSALVELVEAKAEFVPNLTGLATEYETRAGRTGWITVSHGNVERHLDAILARASNNHLFFFLDPCGAGLSFDQVVALHRRANGTWPRTEILLNFNGDLGRRVAANASRRQGDSVLDKVCGPWWRDSVSKGRDDDPNSWEGALKSLVGDYIKHLFDALPGTSVMSIPVRRKYTNQPIFYLVHTTSSGHGVWVMSDAVARATTEWRDEHDLQANHGQGSLFAPDDVVESFESAKQQVRANLLAIAASGGSRGRLPEDLRVLQGGVVGALTDTEIARVARTLAAEGLIRIEPASGGRPDRLQVYPATQPAAG